MDNLDVKNILQQFQIADPTFTRMEFGPVFYSFFMCLLASFFVRFFYIRYANSIAGKLNLGNILPVLSSIKKSYKGLSEYTLTISWVDNEANLNKTLDIFKKQETSVSLIRYTVNEEANSGVFLIESESLDSIDRITKSLKAIDSKCSVTITSPNTSW